VALIEAAESLFAQAGVEAVSTRRIGAEIGSANTNVVAYHFGGKEALIKAVYHHRLPQIDRRRGELHAQAMAAGSGSDLAALMRVFALPLFEQTDATGKHSYARFLAGIERVGLIAIRGEIDADYPETERLRRAMAAALPPSMGAHVDRRLRLATALIVASLQIIDQEAAGRSDEAQRMFNDALAMAAAAMGASPAPNQETENEK
jgi:AcrR family transcriptional regulator